MLFLSLPNPIHTLDFRNPGAIRQRLRQFSDGDLDQRDAQFIFWNVHRATRILDRNHFVKNAVDILFDFCFGMIAFFTTYIFGMLMAKSALLSFLTGQLIPISLFPEVFQKIFDFLPFSSMVYTPVMIYLGKYTGETLAFALGRQFFWVVCLYVLGSVIWKQVTKRLVVLGG